MELPSTSNQSAEKADTESQNNKYKQLVALIAINQVYSEVTDKLVAKVDRAIERNRALQASIFC